MPETGHIIIVFYYETVLRIFGGFNYKLTTGLGNGGGVHVNELLTYIPLNCVVGKESNKNFLYGSYALFILLKALEQMVLKLDVMIKLT